MTTTKSYRNGNVNVTIDLTNGTKLRRWDGEARPLFPESIDLKITDYCDAGCKYCHEKSTKKGLHGKYADVFSALTGLPEGVEIALGGGNPLSHPELQTMLFGMSRDTMRQIMPVGGWIPNLTINQKHFDQHTAALLREMQRQRRVYGIGVSITEPIKPHPLMPNNLVWHVIAGIADPLPFLKLGPEAGKILVLGYKEFGFGAKFNKKEVQDKIGAWRYWIGSIIRSGAQVSFDNLALRQLNIKSIVSPEVWSQNFMGHDGEFTMYIDAVENAFAVSSTSERIPIAGRNIYEMFHIVRERRKLKLL